MKPESLVGWGFGLAIAGALLGVWAKVAYDNAESAAYWDAGITWGASIPQAEQSGMMAGLAAAALPAGLAVLAILSGVALLIAAAVRRQD